MVFAYNPAAQLLQLTLVGVEYMPTAHCTQETVPDVFAYIPAAQLVQKAATKEETLKATEHH